MADLAHDASDSASSEPAGIGLQQANRPTSSDKGKLRVFISYSRDDIDFADQLTAALELSGFECFIDREGVSGGEEWKRSLGNLISEADTVVFVLSPDSAVSEICAWEVDEATRRNKRILSVNCRPLKGASPPPRLRDLNYIFFYAEPKAPGSGFGTGLTKLVTALNTDFDWLREHTRYLQRATEWDQGGRPANRLLSGDDIAEAKAWVARRPKSAPEPTALHLDFIRASEEEAEARSNELRKQLEAMRAALAEAETQRKIAEEWRERTDRILEGAMNIMSKTSSQMDAETLKESFDLYQTGADHGDARSMRNLGYRYQDGRGVAQDYGKAREWFEKAVEMGDRDAMWSLGSLYRDGQGVAQDYGKAREWYEKAAAKGKASAMTRLGNLYADGLGVAQDYGKAREWCEKAAAKGNASAMIRLGELYADGQGVAQDYGKARGWYEKAAAKDNSYAMNNLGWLYEHGQGVAQDYAKAREWYEKAAAKDNADAMNNLGELYRNGQGVAQDYGKAREWLEKAAAKENAGAMFNLGVLYYNGQGVARDYGKAREWYEKGAAKGDAGAMVNLGSLYADGQGVAQDYAKAREWFEKAADKGGASAKAQLQRMPIREAVGTGHYAEALQLQEALAAQLEAAETKRVGKPGEETA
jgi:TPR repeat protein